MQIYVYQNNQQLGPFSEAEINAQLSAGTLSLHDPVWWDGQASWTPLGQSPLAATLSTNVPAIPVPVPGVSPSAPPAGARTSGLAIASLVCGILGFFSAGLMGIPAVILGHISRSQIKKNPALQGGGLALAGLITGYVSFICIFIGIVGISVLIALGNQVKGTFNAINAQINSAQQESPNGTNSNNP
jgi:Flp pilus assembly pilin Flp